ncbi:MAG: CRISPR system precrRNA processing endoribonuclease RAMP protein Cas6 [Geminicoccaceae bacterium]
MQIDLPLTRHRLIFEPMQAGRWPRYSGSAWRGGFGHALKRVVCVMRLRPCAGCALEGTCIYPTTFETSPAPGASKMRLYDRVPHPYVLQPGVSRAEHVGPGEALSVDITLVGRSTSHVAYAVRALEEAASAGLGPDRLQSRLQDVIPLPTDRQPWAVDHGTLGSGMLTTGSIPEVPASPRRAVVELSTPLRLQREGRLVGPGGFTPGDLLVNLIRRLSMLCTFFTERPLEADFRQLTSLARGMRMPIAEVGWVDITRKSSRQNAIMQMGGVVGRFDLVTEGAEELWPFLWLGQWVGAGKGATMGLGQYRVSIPT